MKQHFFIEGRYLGSAARGPIHLPHNELAWPLSKVFYCRTCGEVFAKCPITKPDGSTVPFHSAGALCRKCPPDGSQSVPGSITYPEPEFLAAFPDAVLLWEVQRHLDQLSD
jgi:hypothetical protein